MVKKLIIGEIIKVNAPLYPPFIELNIHYLDDDEKLRVAGETVLMKHSNNVPCYENVDKMCMTQLDDVIDKFFESRQGKMVYVEVKYYYEHVVNVTWRDLTHIALAYIPKDQNVVVLPVGTKFETNIIDEDLD